MARVRAGRQQLSFRRRGDRDAETSMKSEYCEASTNRPPDQPLLWQGAGKPDKAPVSCLSLRPPNNKAPVSCLSLRPPNNKAPVSCLSLRPPNNKAPVSRNRGLSADNLRFKRQRWSPDAQQARRLLPSLFGEEPSDAASPL